MPHTAWLCRPPKKESHDLGPQMKYPHSSNLLRIKQKAALRCCLLHRRLHGAMHGDW